MDNVGRLFLAMDNPVALRQSVADVIFHVMASLRESTEALDMVRKLFQYFALCCRVGVFIYIYILIFLR